MAYPHRKLIPKRHLIEEHNTFCMEKACDPEENKARICSFTCYEVCPSFCKNPTYVSNLYPPPPPPPPPPLKHSVINEKHMLQNGALITGGVVGCALLFLVFMVMKYYNSGRNNQIIRNSPNQFDTPQRFLDEEHDGPVIDPPIWFIVTQGLSPSVINSIMVFKYKKDDGLIQGTECSVCLGEFEEDESLKLLPKCSHAFHISCIDTWLNSHQNCPLCRALIVRGSPDIAPQVSDSETQLENFESNSGNVGYQMAQVENREVRVREDISGNSIKGLCNSSAAFREDEIQPIRRSISLDSSSALMIYHDVGSSNSNLGYILKQGRKNLSICNNLMKSASMGNFLKGSISSSRKLF